MQYERQGRKQTHFSSAPGAVHRCGHTTWSARRSATRVSGDFPLKRRNVAKTADDEDIKIARKSTMAKTHLGFFRKRGGGSPPFFGALRKYRMRKRYVSRRGTNDKKTEK